MTVGPFKRELEVELGKRIASAFRKKYGHITVKISPRIQVDKALQQRDGLTTSHLISTSEIARPPCNNG